MTRDDDQSRKVERDERWLQSVDRDLTRDIDVDYLKRRTRIEVHQNAKTAGIGVHTERGVQMRA